MPLPDFKRGGRGDTSGPPSTSSGPTITLADMEGQGDQSAEHDIRLATPFLLLSKVRGGRKFGMEGKFSLLPVDTNLIPRELTHLCQCM